MDEFLTKIASAAGRIKGPWQFAALLILVILASALYAVYELYALLLASLAVPLLVFALIPWDVLLKASPNGAVVILLTIALSPAFGITIIVNKSNITAANPPAENSKLVHDRDRTERLSVVEKRTLWERSVDTLFPMVAEAQTRGGGFRFHIDSPAASPDPWTTAQCILALGSVDPRAPRNAARLSAAFRYIGESQKMNGWLRDAHHELPSTEVTAWVGLASLSSPSAPLEYAKLALGLIDERQGPEGGWPSFATGLYADESIGDYATIMALEFLLSLRNTTAHQHSVDKDKLGYSVKSAARWILSEYQEAENGWEDVEGEGYHRDLTTLNLLVLTRAKQDGFTFVGSDPRYTRAVRGWLSRLLDESNTRRISALGTIKQKQNIYNDHGQFVKTEYIPASVVWFPWSLVLATLLAEDADLGMDMTNEAVTIADNLWRRAPEAVEAVAGGVTYVAAELLWSLGILGRHYNWLESADRKWQ